MTNDNNPTFRDRIVTMNEEGKRNWIFANQPKGKYYNARTIVGIILLTFLFAAPYIKIDGEPLLLFDIIHRKFVLFGVVFWPQDFHLFVIGLISIIISIVTFTVVYGRVWCGWACPQTIFMELIFRRIEYWIEGSGDQQRIRNNGEDTFDKFWRNSLKHAIFILISLVITHTMLSYFVGVETVQKYIEGSPTENFSVFVALMIFTAAFYFVFAFFREQVCSLVCPYGRLQGALVDNNTLTVIYDYKRGENRGPMRKDEDRKAVGKGDCVNCHKCTTVCPTGIDIRDGIQLECINCTACIDACDSVMERYKLPKGLIRITSKNNIENGQKFRWTPRVIAYTTLLVALIGVLVVLFNLRSDFETTILRVQGSLYQTLDDGRISNIYNYKIVNKTTKEADLSIKLLSPEGEVQLAGHMMKIKEQEKLQGAFLLKLSREQLNGASTKIMIGIYDGDELIDTIESTFVGPN
ncbi:cytochrome c oxidase accessory protein CcoG [Carboxylicivirga caseinilyticus]|uniref:cytochrome c oxidase accessory protein CcoG n=1 Tax=Carboxylicivirga caseinilyticus TaxID=3417572 RepID=UPI003D34851E|nr:cytochrome c oxidase accessory protein CcoG [Marinilabiliaceae bacterium A049]